jgi:hypothetical protein
LIFAIFFEYHLRDFDVFAEFVPMKDSDGVTVEDDDDIFADVTVEFVDLFKVDLDGLGVDQLAGQFIDIIVGQNALIEGVGWVPD